MSVRERGFSDFGGFVFRGLHARSGDFPPFALPGTLYLFKRFPALGVGGKQKISILIPQYAHAYALADHHPGGAFHAHRHAQTQRQRHAQPRRERDEKERRDEERERGQAHEREVGSDERRPL